MTEKGITLGELAEKLKGELTGDRNLRVKNIRGIEEAGCGDLAILLGKKFAPLLEKTKASCAVVPEGVKKAPIPIIQCKNPNLAYKKAAELILPDRIPRPSGIHKTVSFGKNVTLAKNVAIGAYSVIEDGVQIGDGTIIYAHCYIGRSSEIGENSLIYPNVTVREKVKIGNRVILHSGCVVGCDGFGYEMTEKGYEKIPHIGDVILEDDVELGACATVDRAKMAHTIIGRGTKIDNLVQIAHNVTIGKNCIVASQCGISGSVKIGNNVIMGGQVGMVDHVEVGDNVMIAARAALMKSVPANTIMWGIPARPLKKAKMIYALRDKLPEIYERLKALEKKIGKTG
ncbi:MAG: UDP-3-O-(3-hydroxymyristoyl)glucosamine N-acyltransferase [Omnitrophica bacterium]|nr:UDP-3-O-(3-hydroxymyristoyl)glucosamine N-acyltransferase [Candidatus Omnitrophota bacterium]